jgi:ABC-type uncharacterized transport system involved in gliding motility auxiliary subunit
MKTLPKSALKLLKFAIWFGPALLVAGLVAGLISNTWSPATVGLILAGVAIIVGGLLTLGSQPQGLLRRRPAEVGVNAAIATISFIAIIALLNFIAFRNTLRIDFTENQIFTLSPQSQEIVANLPKPLKVVVFTPQINPIDREFLENYRRHSENFQFEFIDPQIQIGLAEQFGVTSDREAYVQYDGRSQLVQTLRDGEGLSEAQLTGTIEQILRDRTPRIYLLQGHGELALEDREGGISQAVESLKNNGYSVEPLNLAQRERIPADADAIIVAGPQQELFAGEVEALREYLQKGGSLLLAIDPNTDPGLDPILEDWGVELDDRLAIDASGSGSVIGLGPGTPVVNSYGIHPITADFGNRISVYPLARPVMIQARDRIQASPLLLTDEQSWAESNLTQENLEFNPETDAPGPLTLGFALSQPLKESAQAETPKDASEATEDAESSDTEASEDAESSEAEASEDAEANNPKPPKEARLVVFGNSSFTANGWFGQQLNRDVFLNSVKWLARLDEANLSIQAREPENRRLTLTIGQAGSIAWLAVLIVPAIGLTAAGAMWWRRR